MHLLNICKSVSRIVFIMTPPPKCCNPFKKIKHDCCTKNLKFLSNKCDKRLTGLFGLYVCAVCKVELYRNKTFQFLSVDKENKIIEQNAEESEAENLNEEKDKDYVCPSVDNKIKKRKLVSAIENIIMGQSSPKKQSLSVVEVDKKIVSKFINDENYNKWVSDFKLALFCASSRQEKIVLLTTIPYKLSIRTAVKEFGVSKRMLSTAKKLKEEKGYLAHPDKKKGRAMSTTDIDKVKDFYLHDDVSRVMPGSKDYKSVVVSGKRQHEQKRLLLGNLADLHTDFVKKFPEVKVSLSVFKTLRPPQCILAGPKGTHNVCVCKDHGNIRLKLRGLKQELARKNINFQTSYRELFIEIICPSQTAACYLGNCENCPGTKKILDDLKSTLENNGITSITFNQWLTTDRCQLLTQTESSHIFIKNLGKELPKVLKHDFIAKSQAEYLEKLKNLLECGEYLVTLDYSENYSFHVQDAIQSQHWSKDQATLHVYVIYHKKNNVLEHTNFVVFSEYINHDATGVHLYNSKMIGFLKNRFGAENIKKIYYFFDGAGSQYKNRFNFMNLLFHEEDFGFEAEWHFFATAHGKGACDGIGGCVKRQAYRASLQGAQIKDTRKLFEWAQKSFPKIYFDFCSSNEYDEHKQGLESRFSQAKSQRNTSIP